MAKYDPLQRHLALLGRPRVTLSFDEIDGLVGGLPRSAREYREWWSNEVGGSHVQSHAWMGAGYAVDSVNITAGVVVFAKSGANR